MTLLALFSMFYLFFVKLYNTVFPAAFTSPDVAVWVQTLSFIANLLLLLFFIFFRAEYVKPTQKILRLSTILMIISFTVVTLISLKKIFLFFPDWFSRVHSLSPFLADLLYRESIHLSSLGFPWINSFFMLFFLYSFYREAIHPENELLIQATRYAVIGAAVLLVLNSAMLLLRIFSDPKILVNVFSGFFMLVVFSAMLMVYASFIYFMATFYQKGFEAGD